MPRDVLSRRRALKAAHGAGEETEHVRHDGQFVQQHGVERLAAVVRLQASEHVRQGIDALGELEQQGRAILGRRLRPGVEGRIRALHRGMDLGAAGLGNSHQDVALGRVVHRVALAFAGHQGTIDQKFGLHIDSRH